MKKLLLSATAFLSVAVSLQAQQIKPCGTYQAREYYLKNVPGYAAKLNAAEAASAAEYDALVQSGATARTATLAGGTYTIPVVFHILHQGEAPGTGVNIDDQVCINALAQVNKDYAKQGPDVATIDPLFAPLYEDSKMQFMLAQKDPYGNCTNGVIHHFDNKTHWEQTDLSNYIYSTYATGNWNPDKYLNIYIVKDIIPSGGVVGGGIIVGYTHLPGTAPVSASDAIVYRYDFLGQAPGNILDVRSLSHEIGHWFGLSHTFGSTNDPGFECGNDDIGDTPKTTGFFSTCPKPALYPTAPSAVTPLDSSDIVNVKFGIMDANSGLNSLVGTIKCPLITLTGTLVTNTVSAVNSATASGVAGGYSDFTLQYGNDYNANTTQTISITSLAKSTDNNYVAMYFDFNSDGDFNDAFESLSFPSSGLLGTQTYTASKLIPANTYEMVRMRVITSSTPISGPTMDPASGEVEDYYLNIGTTPTAASFPNTTMANCDDIRPNFENIMDYSSCPKMFTHGQSVKVRQSATSAVGNRNNLSTNSNLYFTGLLNRTIVFNTTTNQNDTTYSPSTVSPCAPIADFAVNKTQTCAGQSVIYKSTSYNSLTAPTAYYWEFEGGSPSTSTLATQSVTYSTPGTYSVSLTVTNGVGQSTKSVIAYQTTQWNAPVVNLPYIEDFEGQWWPAGWNNVNEDLNSITWTSSNYGAGVLSNQNKSMVLPNADSQSFFPFQRDANVDIMETPSFDFSNVTGVTFSFDYSFARKTGVVKDTFKLQYSLDCGGSWTNMLSTPNTAAMAASGGTVNAPYVPWSATTTSVVPNPKWITKLYSSSVLTALNNKSDVKFRFWFKNDYDNGLSQNLYIDNVNIAGVVGVREFENSLGLSIYPNPTNSSATVEFTSPSNSKVDIMVYDVTGRMVERTDMNATAGVNSKYGVNASGKLTPGIYFVTLTIDNNKVVKKLIIN